ncbi:hypothetical protein M404DRAFT_16208 [Pisolithus tinctorius Marx 270]|uniref:DUF6830 domain-containing protein n=1 Tax=Pisolithus tinctorius Marx 270 TaxID=870435 RepID=A0A0C3IXE1_PISTI|nr:hypothetical protein M404DRAFT_16208 [Pisolithus tinctorius Marx 270]
MPCRIRVYHPNQPAKHDGGMNLLQRMDTDQHADTRNSENVYFPFTSQSEWQLANWLASGVLSQKEIDGYLQLQRNKDHPVSFNTAKDLHACIELLPDVPRWHYQEIKVAPYQTTTPIVLYWRDGLKVIEHLFSNPVFAHCIDLSPYREFEATDQGQQRVYGEFMSADHTWSTQDSLLPGHSFLGVIGASDKTPLTIGTGNKEMHPLLLSIANIHASVCMKATSHSFALAAYLPIPKFRNVPQAIQAVLSVHVYHFAISIVMKNLVIANRDGKVMSDPMGNLRVIHTPLVSWIADYPEQLLIACVSSKNSLISLATAEQFGDTICQPLRVHQHTLQGIRDAVAIHDPCDITAFHKVCLTKHLNGVVEPFWKVWGDACPSRFLTPEALHQWHKFYFDHCLRWVINIVRGEEVDRHLAALQPRIGTRHWANGISKLKQCTGHEHRDLEKVLPAVAAGALPDDVLCALRAITEFIFLAQSLFHYDETIHALNEALREFHHYKSSILTAHGRVGTNGPLDHFQIPKLELAQHIAQSVREMGAPYQWSSDITECCHITHVKVPYRFQCCRFLDRQEKQRLFQLYTTLKSIDLPLLNEMADEAKLMALHYPEATWISSVLSTEQYVGTSHSERSIFNNPRLHGSPTNSRILLTLRPHFPVIPLRDATVLLGLDDFLPALGDFFSGHTYTVRNGRRTSPPNCPLPFHDQHSMQDTQLVAPIQTVQVAPCSPTLPSGRANTVLITHESGDILSADPHAERYLVAQVRAILQPITNPASPPLLYVKFFNFSNMHYAIVDNVRVVSPAPKIKMFLPLGDIIPLDNVQQVVQLVPKFGVKSPRIMTCDNCLDVGREFYINSFADKETFHAVLSYQ